MLAIQDLFASERGLFAITLVIAATVFKYLGIDLEAQWQGPAGRPVPILAAGAEPIRELF